MKQQILDYLRSYRLMSLSTYGDNPWICWVFYIIDDDFNLYFVSPPSSQHINDIKKNKSVACAITDTSQNSYDVKKGVQLWGEINEVTGANKLKTFFKMWKELINVNESRITYQNYVSKAITSKVYKVTPKKIKWFNEKLDGEEFVLNL